MPYLDGRPDVAVGDSGEWVVELQRLLETLGLYVGDLDGACGDRTAAAVRELGLVHHVDLDHDVLVGEQVWTALVALTAMPAGDPAPPVDGGYSADHAWVWRDGTWSAAPFPAAAASTVGGDLDVSADGHWRWVDGQWEPNA